MKKALLVIDMQNVCVGEEHAEWFQYDNCNLLNAVNQAIAENCDNTIIYIKNIMKKNLINRFAPFQAYEGSREVELVKGLEISSDYIFLKYTGDAFSNPELNKLLLRKKIDTIEVIGVDGGGCVAITALSAIKKGYRVIVNEKAIGTTKALQKQKVKYEKKLKQLGATYISGNEE